MQKGEALRLTRVLLLLFIGMAAYGTVSKAEGEFINRLNYGVIAQKIGNVSILDGYFKQVVHVRLPSVPRVTRPLPPLHCREPIINWTSCSVVPIINNVFELWDRIVEVLRATNDEIYFMIPDFKTRLLTDYREHRSSRGLIDAIGTRAHRQGGE